MEIRSAEDCTTTGWNTRRVFLARCQAGAEEISNILPRINPFDFVERNLVFCPIIKLRGAGRSAVAELLSVIYGADFVRFSYACRF
jgi:hypothetical protein